MAFDFQLHHPYQMGRKLVPNPKVPHIEVVAASEVASITLEDTVVEACSYWAIVGCTLVVVA